jgi:hypothetical protein
MEGIGLEEEVFFAMTFQPIIIDGIKLIALKRHPNQGR